MTAAFLVEQFQREQAQYSVAGGHHLGTRVVRCTHDLIEPQLCEQGPEEEHARRAASQAASRFQRQRFNIGDFDLLFVGRVVGGAAQRSSAGRPKEKGGACSRSHWPRNSLTQLRTVPQRIANQSATSDSARCSTKTARNAS